jgi:hypothetical protein
MRLVWRKLMWGLFWLKEYSPLKISSISSEVGIPSMHKLMDCFYKEFPELHCTTWFWRLHLTWIHGPLGLWGVLTWWQAQDVYRIVQHLPMYEVQCVLDIAGHTAMGIIMKHNIPCEQAEMLSLMIIQLC